MTTINRPGPYTQHHRLRRLRQPHRRRLEPRAGPVARLHPEPEHRRLHRLRRARHGHRGHALRGHHRRRPRQHLQPRWPIWSTPTAPSAPGPSISTTTARRPGSRSPVGRQRDLGQLDLRQHRDRRLSSRARDLPSPTPTTVPGIYNPITNTGTLSTVHRGHTTAIAGIRTATTSSTTARSPPPAPAASRVSISTYGVVTNCRHGRRHRRGQHRRAG